MEDNLERIESLEKRIAAMESQWAGFKRAARDGFLMIAQWIKKNGEAESNGDGST